MPVAISTNQSPESGRLSAVERTDYVEFYVGNARQAAHYYRSAFGMKLTGYSALRLGCAIGQLCARTGSDTVRADDALRRIVDREHVRPRRRCTRYCADRRRCGLGVSGNDEAWRARSARAVRPARHFGRRSHGVDRRLWRHSAYFVERGITKAVLWDSSQSRPRLRHARPA